MRARNRQASRLKMRVLLPEREQRSLAQAFSMTDVLNAYSAPSATPPVWPLVGTVPAAGYGIQSLSVTYTLPAGSAQVVRAVLRDGGVSSPSLTGRFDVKDNLAFSALQ